MTTVRWVLAASGWIALAATALPAGQPLRVALVTAFLLLCPGLAALRPRRPVSLRGAAGAAALESAVLTLVLSLALTTLVAVALFLGGVFSQTRGVLALAVLTSVLALLPRPLRRGGAVPEAGERARAR